MRSRLSGDSEITEMIEAIGLDDLQQSLVKVEFQEEIGRF